VGYVVALLLQAVAVTIDVMLFRFFPTFALAGLLGSLAVALVALGWGAGPSLCGTFVGAILLELVVTPPLLSLHFGGPQDAVELGLFVVVGCIISVVAGQTARTRRAMAQMARSLAQEQAKSERERKRLRAVLDVLPVGVSLASAQGEVVEANGAALSIWGGESPLRGDRLHDQPYRGWWADTGQAVALTEWPLARAILAGEVQPGREIEIACFDGQRKTVLNSAAPMRDDSGAVIGGVAAIVDITERKQVEAERGRLARDRELLLESTGLGIYGLDLEGRCTFINRAATDLLGYRSDEVVGEPMHRLIHHHHADGSPYPEEDCPILRAFRLGKGIRLEDEVLWRREGTYVPVAYSSLPIVEEGITRGAVIVFTDITERKRLEEAQQRLAHKAQLAAAEASARASELEAIFEAMTDGVYIYDDAGQIVRMNAAGHALAELSAEPHLISPPVDGNSAHYLALGDHGEPLPPDYLPPLRLLGGEVLTGTNAADVQMAGANGEQMQLSITGAPLRNAEGHIVGAVAIARDVTERRRLEWRTQETLHALLRMAETLVDMPEGDLAGPQPTPEAPATSTVTRRLAELANKVLGCARVGIVSIDPGTEVVHPVAVIGPSSAYERAWWAKVEGTLLRDHFDDATMARLVADETLLLDLRQPPYSDRDTLGAESLLVVPMCVNARLVGLVRLDFAPGHTITAEEQTLAGAITKLTALVIDRARLWQDRAEARASELALREANRRMDEFLGIASHEIKNPLASVKANVQLLARRLSRRRTEGLRIADLDRVIQTARAQIDRIDGQVDRLNRLVDDLLDVSRVQNGKLELRPAPNDLAVIVRDAVAEQQLVWPIRTISLQLPAETPIPILADADRTGQVVTNYLTNALKYSPTERPVEVTLRVEGAVVRLLVRDEGQGLPPEEHARIWERFHRVEGINVQSGTGIGLGLGLHIARVIVERQGGQVGLESAPGKGSTFWFTLPLARD
jgi:PAS domain S-box-containing protein